MRSMDGLAPNQQRIIETGPPGSIIDFDVDTIVSDR